MNFVFNARIFLLLLILLCPPAWAEVLVESTASAERVGDELPKNAVWIDVRTPQEFASGHVASAHSIPFDRIEVGAAELKLDKDAPIYLYCAVGGRAGMAKKRLDALGYTHVTNVGGLTDARNLLSHSAQ